MSERYDHPTGQVPTVRRGPSRVTKLATGAGVAVVLALLILNVLVWSNWSGQPGTPVSSVAAPTGRAEPAEPTPPAEPEASPGTDGTAGQGGAGTGGGGDPGGGSGGGGAPDPAPENPDPEEPEDPEDPEIVVIDPAVVLPLISSVVTEVVPASCLNDTTAAGTIEITALDAWYPMTVEYRWLRSGEFIGPTQSVEVDGNTALPVTTQWQSIAADGWVALEVKGPLGVVSEQVQVASCVS